MSESQKAKSIDLMDLELEEEPMDLDPDADAFAGPPPPPDGIHLAKIKLFKQGSDSGLTSGTAKNGKDFNMARVELRIIAPGQKYDNSPVFDRVSTLIMDSTGTCAIAGVLKALKVSVPSRISKNALTKMLLEAIESEPELKIQTAWSLEEKNDEGKYKAIVYEGKKLNRQSNFPKKDNGEYEHIVDGQSAQAKILKYLPA
jgi:hypothetical protein